MIIGLTGGIATGKSTVTGMLRELGAFVVDADLWARRVVEPDQPALLEIVEFFGTRVLRADGSLNRSLLANIIFQNETARKKLNQVTHPRVREGMWEETTAFLAETPNEPVVWDVPLLFEGETRLLVDVTLLVYVPVSVQRQRLVARDHLTEAAANARIAAQMSIEEKRALADYVIDNSGGLEQTRRQVNELWQTLRTLGHPTGA
ncbi:dephospho-CoA kinase [Alicyclobacillaceae bacterium I2511]|nr:dephospho-CoA kinase [Alicyclobacillaceae bacterium I2511]